VSNKKTAIKYALGALVLISLSACKLFESDKPPVQLVDLTFPTPATFSGDTSGSISEEDTAAVTGMLTVTDPDAGQASIQAQSNTAQTYGSFSIDAAGAWSYTLDNSNANVQALNANATITDEISVSSVDGATQTITITITGVNDVAVLGTGTGVDAGTTLSNSTTATTGTLSLTDADSTPDSVVAQTNTAGTYGTFSIADDGVWTYTVDTANATVQALTSSSIFWCYHRKA